ncbi:MAG: leucyl/phenylalanyl-tRNA--protein transferase [Deltaproteobacteria bacterium]|nr:leucyl/phenylalanyl-tRNA--protein transferase [Deltaproteobacteria bacterium]
MPVYRLIDEIVFPPPDHAEPDGLLAVGGDLSSERLLLAYKLGIFPWYSEGQPILWWSPDPRLVLELEEFHISRRLRQILKKGGFKVTFDKAFKSVIEACASVPREGQDGTWITPEMQAAYIHLHRLGFAHSVESWFDGELAGGIYGVSLGRCFFGESMFSYKSNASKVALATLVEQLKAWEFHMLDAQVTTPHLLSLGAKEIPRSIFLKRLGEALSFPTVKGRWRSSQV